MPPEDSDPAAPDASSIADNPFGGRESCHEIYTSHAGTVYATALAVLKNPDAAHDVVHDVFLRAWEHAAQYDPARGSVGTWLRAVARNLSIDRLRASQRLSVHDEVSLPLADGADELVSRISKGQEIELVWAAFEALPPIYQELIDLAFSDQLSHSAIAKRLGQPLGTVKTRIRHALSLLRQGTQHSARPVDGRASPRSSRCDAFTTCDANTDALAARVSDTLPLTVLVVDDDDETVRLVAAVLRKFGIDPQTRTSAQTGLTALAELWPDVLISDLKMPDEDGYSLLRRARALAKEYGRPLPAAAFTSWGGEDERSRALLAGFDLFINKPVHPYALVSAVALLGA